MDILIKIYLDMNLLYFVFFNILYIFFFVYIFGKSVKGNCFLVEVVIGCFLVFVKIGLLKFYYFLF